MKAILLPIHPKWAAMIYAGVKRYELRKNEPRDEEFLRQPTRPVFLCETGTGLVTGACTFEAATRCTEAADAAFYSTVPVEQVMDYGTGRDGKYHLWRISEAGRLSLPAPVTLFGVDKVPQGWRYVTVGEDGAPG